MKGRHISRRDFLKFSAIASGSLALPSLIGVAPQLAQAADTGPVLHAPQPTFTPLPTSQLTFGNPTDISMGWDGTLWAIDPQGATHVYDPIQKQWQPHGSGVDAAAWLGNVLYCFRDDAFVTVTNIVNAPTAGPKQSIATTWPNLPASFQLGVTGAANAGGALYLFKGGLYVNASAATATVLRLTDLTGWPSASAWQEGVIDAVYGDGSAVVALFRNAQYILADLATKQVTSGPQPVNAFPAWQAGQVPADFVSMGIDAAAGGVPIAGSGVIFRGVTALAYDDAGDPPDVSFIPGLIGNWPSEWLPQLRHAPSGRMGNLWATTTSGGVVYNDGNVWNSVSLPNNVQAVHASVGNDGSIFAAASGAVHQYDGAGWAPVATTGLALAQLSVGDGSRIWVRDGNNNVYRVGPNTAGPGQATFTLNIQVGQPTHIAANYDGTVWHCNNNANASRLISEGQDPSAVIPVSGVTSVTKVASTGFGSAHCLTDQGIYTYDSPYVFKTSASYDALGQKGVAKISMGAGKIFFTVQAFQGNGTNFQSYVVALDAQTGAQLWLTAVSDPNVQNTMPVYDPILNLAYVASAPTNPNDSATHGWIIAIDAMTGAISWASSKASDGSTIAGIDATPALSGTQLCFGDRSGRLHMFDTKQALADDKSGKVAQAVWSIVGTGEGGWDDTRLSTPTISDGQVYFAAWDFFTGAGLAVYPMRCEDQDGTGLTKFNVSTGASVPLDISTFVPAPPILGQASFDGGKTLSPAAFISSYLGATSAIFALSLENSEAYLQFTTPQPQGGEANFTSGLAYDAANGVVYVGDSIGRLFALNNTSLQPTLGTPLQVDNDIVSTPVIYNDPNGQVTVYFGTLGSSTSTNAYLFAFDVADKNLITIATGQTAITVLSDVINGVIYAAGSFFGANALGQVFGIRVSEIEQALRDFIIESHLMQDFDDRPVGNTTYTGVARYQTHLTIVDDNKAPRPFEPVKIWADEMITLVIDGQSYPNVGPTTPASAQTGSDGSLTIVSDADDLFATPLRAWASFMDPYERIVVYPDQEFHDRVMAAQANPDPTQINLSTVANYSGGALFTAQEQQQQQPQQIANAIKTMAGSLGINSNSTSALRAFGTRRVTGVPDPYIAYADLPGANYLAADTPSTRATAILAPAGFSYAISVPNDGNSPRVFNTLSHAEATAAIDALDGEPWMPLLDSAQDTGVGSPGLLGGFLSFFKSLWKHLKSAVTTITHIVISIGKEIYLGIRWIENNVVKFFKNPIKFIEDAVAAIASFFKQLAKDIKNVVEAISILFHLDEIKKTHQWLAQEVLHRVNGNPSDPATYPGIKNILQDTIIKNVDSFFNQGTSAIKGFLDNLRRQIEPNDQIGTQPKMNSTVHSAYTIGPQGQNPKSHAVQCHWATQKAKANAPAATETTSDLRTVADDDPLVAFINEFASKITSDTSNLKSVFDQFKQDIRRLFNPKSMGDFLKTGLAILLDALEALLLGVMDLAQAFTDGLLAAFASVIDLLFDPNTGILTRTLHIPVLSWLYGKLFGEPLTFLNLLTLVAAIPVTIIYRVVEGHYPSKDLSSQTASATLKQPARAALNPVDQKVFGVFGAVNVIVAGIFNSIADGEEDPDPIVGKAVLALGISGAIVAFPYANVDKPEPGDWTTFGILSALGVLNVFGAIDFATKEIIDKITPWIGAFMNLCLLIAVIVIFVEWPAQDFHGNLAFVENIASTFAGILNPAKLAGDIGKLVVAAADVLMGIVVGAIGIVVSITSPGDTAFRYHSYFPFVPAVRAAR